MIVYFSGSTFNQVIENAIEMSEQMVFIKETANEIDLLKYVKQNISKLDQVDIVIIDISVVKNTQEEILQAIEMLRTMYDSLKIIIFAAYMEPGNSLLTSCFNMGILNIITADDYREIRDELIYCIETGKTFKEALAYKQEKTDKIVVKHELKKTVYKKMIAVTGTESNIGVTHNAIILSNYLRSKGFMVALVEMNDSNAFASIADAYDEKLFQDGYFTMQGVDIYPSVKEDDLKKIMEHSYNFVVLDFGAFEKMEHILFERCDEKIIISGSKAWEINQTNKVFEQKPKEALEKYIFCFNYTKQKDYKAIREGMKDLKNVHFLKYSEDPFCEKEFVDGDEIFAEYLPDEPEEEKKGFFVKRAKKGEKHGISKKKDIV